MNHPEFMAAIEDIYGEYKSPILKKLTAVYIKENFQESELDNILAMITIKVNPKFKTPPTAADFEEHFPKINLELEAHKWYDMLNKTGCALDNVVISEIRAQKALEVFGGWTGFCKRDPQPENEIWHRKNFVEAFIKTVPGNEQPKILYGESSRKYEKQPLLFGNKEICEQIMDENIKPLQIISDMARGFKI